MKAGSIVPIGPRVQYATEKKWDDLELRVYPGADGEFTLYEDENDDYNYEKGLYSLITFKWNDAQRRLTIDARKGSYRGMSATRTFNVSVVRENRGTGVEPSTTFDKTIRYSGEKAVVNF